jgi:hypothetical protein
MPSGVIPDWIWEINICHLGVIPDVEGNPRSELEKIPDAKEAAQIGMEKS